MPPKSKAAAKPEAPTVDDKATHLVVTSSVPGFRRAGRAWPAEVTVVAIDEFDEDQVRDLLTEPKLSVVASVGDPTAEKK